jgi:hypothetical protein
MARDVWSINDLDTLNRFLQNVNDFVVEHENYGGVKVNGLVVDLVDESGRPIGSITKYTKSEDVKFEPDFRSEIFE